MAFKDIHEIRVRMLRTLIGEQKIAAFAEERRLDATYLSQLLNGFRPIGEKAARNIEGAAGVKSGYLDVLQPGTPPAQIEWYHRAFGTLAGNARFERAKKLQFEEPRAKYGNEVEFRAPVRAFVPEEEPGEMEVRIPEHAMKFSGGAGAIPTFEEIHGADPVTYQMKFFQRERMNPGRTLRFRVVGRSMEPLLYPGDSILVNLDENVPQEGLVYAFRHGEELKVKRLIPKADGSLILRSVNREEFPDDLVPASQVQEQIHIIGRVRDRSGRGGL